RVLHDAARALHEVRRASWSPLPRRRRRAPESRDERGQAMSSFERTFTVSVPPARAWRAFTDPADIEVWFAERFESGGAEEASEAATVGGAMHFEPTEVVPNERLVYKQWAENPDSGIVTTVVFEAEEHGTKITFTQAGFGAPNRFSAEPTHRGMHETLDDL